MRKAFSNGFHSNLQINDIIRQTSLRLNFIRFFPITIQFYKYLDFLGFLYYLIQLKQLMNNWAFGSFHLGKKEVFVFPKNMKACDAGEKHFHFIKSLNNWIDLNIYENKQAQSPWKQHWNYTWKQIYKSKYHQKED